jgi:hypothetical protein
MKVVVAKYFAKTPLLPPISLVKEDEKEYSKGNYVSMKLRATPTDEHSPTHEIQVPYFKSGSCEQFFDFLDKVKAVFVGQNLTTGAQKVAFMRTVLKGDALSHFSQYFVTAGNENAETFEEGVKSLITHIFPVRALRIQKRYMRRYMRKPRDMKMRTYRNRVVELNNYLARFPSDFNDAQKIDDEEIVDILEFGTPNKWQYEMVRMGFDSATATSQQLVEFCERLEFTEEVSLGHNQNEAMPKPGPSGGKTGRSYAQPKSSRSGASHNPKHSNFKRQKVDTDVSHNHGSYDPEKYCTLHGTYGHDLNSCKVMMDQAKKMRSAWQTTSSKGAGQNDRIFQKKGHEKDLHAFVQKMVQGAMQQQSKKRKAGSVHFVEKTSTTAKMPSKKGEEEVDEDKDDDSDFDFGSLNLKTPESDDSDSDEDLYA